MTTESRSVASDFCLPDAMWERMEGMLPKFRQSKKGGRPRLSWRQVLNGIFYVLRTGCQWKALPPEFGSGSSAHRYFQLLVKRKIFEKVWSMALEEYDQLHGLEWKWQSMDGAMTKAPLGGEKNRSQSNGSSQNRNQAKLNDRRQWSADWTSRVRCQHTR